MAIRTLVTRGFGNGTFNGTIPLVVLRGYAAAADVTAPTLSNATGTATSATTADGSVTTDEANGTLYWVVTASASQPSVAQVQAGQDHTGAAAQDSGNQSVSATGAQNVAATGLTSGAWYFHFQHQDAAANDSDVESSASFSTAVSIGGKRSTAPYLFYWRWDMYAKRGLPK